MKSYLTLCFTLLIICLTISSGFSQDRDQQIVYHTFNGNFEEANSLIDEALERQPNHPKYHYLRTNLAFYSRYIGGHGQTPEALLDMVVDNGEKAIAAAEESKESTANKFYIGASYGLLSRAHFMKDRSVFDAYSAAKDAKSYLEEVIEEDPNFNDAYVGLAVIEYFAATRLQGWWQETVAWITGMSGDKEKALEYYQITAREGNLCKPEAQFILSLTYQFMEPNPELARQYMTAFVQEYPDNNFIGNNYRRMQLQDLVADRGVPYLVENIDSLQTAYAINNDNVLNQIGYNFIGEEDYNNALVILKLNADLYPAAANCFDSIGECYMLMGNNSEAIRYYKMAREKVDDDPTRNEAAKQFLRDNIDTMLQRLNAS